MTGIEKIMHSILRAHRHLSVVFKYKIELQFCITRFAHSSVSKNTPGN